MLRSGEGRDRRDLDGIVCLAQLELVGARCHAGDISGAVPGCDFAEQADVCSRLGRIRAELVEVGDVGSDAFEDIPGPGVSTIIIDRADYTDTLTVRIGEEDVRLTRTECAILKLLMQDPDIPVGKTAILDKISLDTPDCTERSLKQHISNIRRKLQAVNGEDYIEAVYGIGFKMRS